MIPWKKEWQPTPAFLPGECHGQRSLVGYSPWGRIEPDTTEWLTLSLSNLFWHRGLVSWKTIFSQIGGDGSRMIQAYYVYCVLYFYYYYIHSTSDHQALDPGGWGPLCYGTRSFSRTLSTTRPHLSWCPSTCSFLAPATFPGQNQVHPHMHPPICSGVKENKQGPLVNTVGASLSDPGSLRDQSLGKPEQRHKPWDRGLLNLSLRSASPERSSWSYCWCSLLSAFWCWCRHAAWAPCEEGLQGCEAGHGQRRAEGCEVRRVLAKAQFQKGGKSPDLQGPCLTCWPPPHSPGAFSSASMKVSSSWQMLQ